jgi:hypothetical protein
VACVSCGALHWREEATALEAGKEKPDFSQCCQKNKVTLPSVHADSPGFPLKLQLLFTGSSDGKQLGDCTVRY